MNKEKIECIRTFTDGNLTAIVSPRGGEDIKFQEGVKTGNMKQYGLSIAARHGGSFLGGCINREETIALRDWLNQCIELWANE